MIVNIIHDISTCLLNLRCLILGGIYSGEMKVKECTHLIVNEPKGKELVLFLLLYLYILP